MKKKVEIFSVKVGGHDDSRRTITDIVFPKLKTFLKLFGELTINALQIKVLQFKEDAVVGGRAVGNHWHTEASGRTEIFVVVGDPEVDLITFFYRRHEQPVEEAILRAGDACFIPPGWTHAFRVLHSSAQLWGFGNMEYNSAHDIPDVIAPDPLPPAA